MNSLVSLNRREFTEPCILKKKCLLNYMVQIEMEELAMNLDFEKNYLAFKKVVLLGRPKMFYFTVLF